MSLQLIKDRITNVIIRLNRRKDRFQQQLTILEANHLGKEQQFTYWGGYEMGRIKGKISEIEDQTDILEEILNDLTNYGTN